MNVFVQAWKSQSRSGDNRDWTSWSGGLSGAGLASGTCAKKRSALLRDRASAAVFRTPGI